MKHFKQVATFLLTIIFLLVQQALQSQNNNTISGQIQADQFQLPYVLEGEGQAAIVVGSSIYYPRAFSQNLRQHLKLVFLDHRGFAPTPENVDIKDYALDKILMDIERTRQQLKLGKIIIIGHSGHSFMALEYAKKYPEQVSHVVMIGIAPSLSGAHYELIQRTWKESVDPERKKVMKENLQRLPDEKLTHLSPSQVFIQSYIRNAPKAWYDPHFDATALWEGVEVNMDMFNYMWGQVFRDIDITEGLENFQKPVFLALGRYDYLVAPPLSWEPYRSKFHDLSLNVFEKSGHTPFYEEAELFDKALLEWLALKQD